MKVIEIIDKPNPSKPKKIEKTEETKLFDFKLGNADGNELMKAIYNLFPEKLRIAYLEKSGHLFVRAPVDLYESISNVIEKANSPKGTAK